MQRPEQEPGNRIRVPAAMARDVDNDRKLICGRWVRWDDERAARAISRLRTIAREASMQSRRARVPAVGGVVDIAALAARPGLVVADRGGVHAGELPVPAAPGWTVLVGPEGGLGPDELDRLGSTPRLTLGPTVLRAVTAPVAAVALLADRAAQVSPE